MLYGLVKIIKNCLKYWYIFIITLIIVAGLSIVGYNTSLLYVYSFDCRAQCFNSEALQLSDYISLNKALSDIVCEYYLDTNVYKMIEDENLLKDDQVEIVLGNHYVSDFYSFTIKSSSCSDVNKIKDYIKSDFQLYCLEQASTLTKSDNLVSNSLQIYGDNEIETEHWFNLKTAIILFVCVYLIEFVIMGIITIIKDTFEFDGEIIERFNKPVMVKKYNINKNNFNLELELLKNKNVVVVCENKDYTQKNNELKNITMVNLKDCLFVNEEKKQVINSDVVIIELVKDSTKLKDISELVDLCSLHNIDDIKFITREKVYENIVSK